MKHTLILTPGTWEVEGKYTNESDAVFAAEGTLRIEHHDHLWLYESWIELADPLEPDVRHEWEIQPWNEKNDFLNWQAAHTLMGNLKGKFLLIAETIISQFYSEEGDYMGSEVMLMQEEDKYYNRGTTFVGDHKLHSWSLNLRRQF